jgi:hypothetical protein
LIKRVKAEKIFLIISSDIRQDFLSECNSLDAIDSIFIYSESNQVMTNAMTKIVGIYICESDLIESIRKTLRLCEKNQAAFSLYNQQEKNTRDLTQESGSFLFFQLFKDVLLNMQQTLHSKREMVENCKAYCRQKANELEDIELFDKTYKSSEAIQWYTKDSFVYRLVNKALRTEDIGALYTYRFFIADVCTNLSSKHNLLKKKQQILKLYRGAILPSEEIQRLKNNVGNLKLNTI